MSNLMKMTKKQLIDVIECGQDTQFDSFKEECGLPFHTEDEWIGYIHSLQETNKELREDLEKAVAVMKVYLIREEMRTNQGGR